MKLGFTGMTLKYHGFHNLKQNCPQTRCCFHYENRRIVYSFLSYPNLFTPISIPVQSVCLPIQNNFCFCSKKKVYEMPIGERAMYREGIQSYRIARELLVCATDYANYVNNRAILFIIWGDIKNKIIIRDD